MRRYNSKLFRVARAIVKDDAEAEDALQDTYLEAYRRIGSFRGESQLVTWLTRIVINQALMRLRRQKRDRVVVPFSGDRGASPTRARADTAPDMADARIESPSDATMRAEVRRMLERRIDELPVAFRTVFVMREVEDLSVEETAASLSIPAATVRTQALPREGSSARSARPRHGLGNGRGLSVRRRAVRSCRGRRSRARQRHRIALTSSQRPDLTS